MTRISRAPRLEGLVRTGRIILWALPAIVLLFGFYTFDLPMIRGDGLGYFFWLHSIVHDRDLALENQYEEFAPLVTYQLDKVSATGRVSAPFAFGAALIWAPLYGLGIKVLPLLPFETWFATQISRNFPVKAYAIMGPAPGVVLCLATNLLALCTVYMALDATRRRTSLAAGVVAAIAVAFGTPFFYYSAVEPSMGHLPGAFVSTVLFWLFFRFNLDTSRDQWLVVWGLVGLALGLASTVRWQLALIGVPLGALLLLRRQWKSLGVFCLGALALAWATPALWKDKYNRLLTVPGIWWAPFDYLVGPRFLGETLFSGCHGLFTWSPIVALSLLGMTMVPKKRRVWVWLALGVLLLQLLINASILGWWGGWSFGMRRLTELYPLYVLGLAWLLHRLGQSLKVPGWILGIALPGLFATWTTILMLLFTRSYVHPGRGTHMDALRFLFCTDPMKLKSLWDQYLRWMGLAG